jgi:hypothetical protein
MNFLDQNQTWASVRMWLLDLADEFRAALDDGTLPAEVGPDRVWLTREGRAVLLDFPCPGSAAQPTRRIADQAGAQEFLDQIATSALSPRVPLHAREFLQTLRARRFESAALVAGNLQSLLERPAEVTETHRFLSIAIAPVFAFLFTLAIVFGWSHAAKRFDARWAAQHADRPSLRLILEVQYELGPTNPTLDRWCSVVLSGKYRDAITDEHFWEENAGEDPFGAWRGMCDTAVTAHPTVSDDELRAADLSLAPYLRKQRERETSFVEMARGGAIPFLNLLLVSAALGLIGTWILGVPPALRLNGLALVNAKGKPASRLRAFVRGVLGWLPILAGAFWVAMCATTPWLSGGFPSSARLYVIMLCGFFSFSMRHPSRSLNDYLSRTWIVPK